MPEVYPAAFPAPRFNPYSWDVDVGLLRTPMDGGLSRQRRLYDVMPHSFDLAFLMPLSLLYEWQDWVNQHGYDFFEMPMVSWFSSQEGATTSVHFVRFTSRLAMRYSDRDSVEVSVKAELSPAQVSNYTPPAP